MREIKFRVWNDGRIYYSKDFDNINFRANGDVFRVWLKGGNENDANRYILVTNLMQYTGMKDRNGKEIYEGDVVEYISDPRYFPGDKPEKICSVVEYCPAFAFTPIPGKDFGGGPDGMEERRDFIIIGNIYENPELLTGREKDGTRKSE